MAEPSLGFREVDVELDGRRILDDIGFEISEGELVWLRGLNGSGKSTLLRTAAGLLSHTGQVRIFGDEPELRRARREFAFVHDRPVLYDDLTLEEHAQFMGLAYGSPDGVKRISGILDAFGLRGRQDEFPVSHSRGMQQKLSLALAFGLPVPLLLLDEPYTGLDVQSTPVLDDLIREHIEEGGSILITTHKPEVSLELAKHIHPRSLELAEGRLV